MASAVPAGDVIAREDVLGMMSPFAAAMGTCILITGFMMQEAMKFLVDFQFQRVQRYDLELAFKDERTGDALGEIERLADRPVGERHQGGAIVLGEPRPKAVEQARHMLVRQRRQREIPASRADGGQ